MEKVALLLIGVATSIWTEQAILYIMIAGLAIATLFFVRPAPDALQLTPVKTDIVKHSVDIKSLFAAKGFPIILLLVILLQGAHASYYNFGFIFLDDLGVSGFYIGVILNVAILFEILFFTRADKWLANIRISTAAQGIYAAFAMSLSTAILTFPGGYLYDISPRLAFLGMIVCSVPAVIIVFMTRKKYTY